MKKKGNTILDMLYSGGYNHSGQKLKYPFTHIKKVLQNGGKFEYQNPGISSDDSIRLKYEPVLDSVPTISSIQKSRELDNHKLLQKLQEELLYQQALEKLNQEEDLLAKQKLNKLKAQESFRPKFPEGGILFPDATTYNQVGAYDGTIHYTQDTLTQPNGRPSQIKTNPGLFQSGGLIRYDNKKNKDPKIDLKLTKNNHKFINKYGLNFNPSKEGNLNLGNNFNIGRKLSLNSNISQNINDLLLQKESKGVPNISLNTRYQLDPNFAISGGLDSNFKDPTKFNIGAEGRVGNSNINARFDTDINNSNLSLSARQQLAKNAEISSIFNTNFKNNHNLGINTIIKPSNKVSLSGGLNTDFKNVSGNAGIEYSPNSNTTIRGGLGYGNNEGFSGNMGVIQKFNDLENTPKPFQNGGYKLPEVTVRPDNRPQQLLLENMDKPMVKRMFDSNAPQIYLKGEKHPSTHLMKWGEYGSNPTNPEGYVIAPSLIQDNKTGKLRFAKKGETKFVDDIYLPADKYSKHFAVDFSEKGYKQAANDLIPWFGGRKFQSGGSLSVETIDENDTLPLGDSDLLSYRDKPVGIKMVLTKSDLKPISGTFNQSPMKHMSCNTSSKFNPFKRESGGNIASTKSDFQEGLNKGINVFPFPTQGLKKMTTNPPSGSIPYPIEYQGYTDGVQTDEGVALPGEEFEVDGDTVVETPDLSSLSLNDAFDYAEDNKLPIFKWRNNTYPMKKYNKMLQEGGLFSSKVTNNVKLSPIYTNE